MALHHHHRLRVWMLTVDMTRHQLMFMRDCGEIEGQLKDTYTHVAMTDGRRSICQLWVIVSAEQELITGDVRQIYEEGSLMKGSFKGEQMPLQLRILRYDEGLAYLEAVHHW